MTDGPWQPGSGRPRPPAGQAETQAAGEPAKRAEAATGSPFVPLLLVGLALLGWTVFQTVELISEHHQLRAAHSAQQRQLEQSQKLRASLSGLASDTQKLADDGDAGAKLIVDQLHHRGITINPNASSSASPP